MKPEDTKQELMQQCARFAKTLENFCKNQHRAWLFEKLDDFLDTGIEVLYTFNSRGELMDVYIPLGIGGPGYFIDTSERAVIGNWGTSRVECPLSCDCLDMILDHYDTEIWRKWG